MKWRCHREKQVKEKTDQTFSVGHVKSEILTRHPKGGIQEAAEHAGIPFRRRGKLETN